MIHLRARILSVAILGLAALNPGPAFSGSPIEGGFPRDGIEAITRPSADVTLSFVRPGKIAKILVKEGRDVEVGDLLVRQDDQAEQFQLAQLKAQAEDTTRIKAAKAQMDQKKVTFTKTSLAAKRGAATDLEVQYARLEVTIAELSLRLARLEHEQDNRKYEEVKVNVDRMRIRSPVAGTVEQVFVETGESVDAMAEVIRIVHVDPLWMDVAVPLSRARNLQAGQAARVAFDRQGTETVTGRINYVSSVADAASETIMVRVEAANVSCRPAGERVYVTFAGPRDDVIQSKTDHRNAGGASPEEDEEEKE